MNSKYKERHKEFLATICSGDSVFIRKKLIHKYLKSGGSTPPVDPNYITRQFPESALSLCIKMRFLDNIKTLLLYEANPFLSFSFLKSPYESAVNKNYRKIVYMFQDFEMPQGQKTKYTKSYLEKHDLKIFDWRKNQKYQAEKEYLLKFGTGKGKKRPCIKL